MWKAWVDPNQIVKWWGPRGFSTTSEQRDFRVGGVWRHTMIGPDGSAAMRDVVVKEYGAIEGGKQTMQRLAEHLKESK